MEKIRYDANIIKYISIFESLTGTKLKDCIAGDKLLFIVQEGQIGKAIGRNGVNVRRISNILKRDIKIVEFSNDVLQFIKNMVYPITIKSVDEAGGAINIAGNDTRTRGMLIGRDSKNLNFLTRVVRRHFNVGEIRVV